MRPTTPGEEKKGSRYGRDGLWGTLPLKRVHCYGRPAAVIGGQLDPPCRISRSAEFGGELWLIAAAPIAALAPELDVETGSDTRPSDWQAAGDPALPSSWEACKLVLLGRRDDRDCSFPALASLAKAQPFFHEAPSSGS